MFVVQVGGYFDGYYNHETPVSIEVCNHTFGAIHDGWGDYSTDIVVHNYGHDSWMLPGFIDSHVHLSWDPEDKPENIIHIPDELLLHRTYEHIRQAAHVGVTGLRDLGDCRNAVVKTRHDHLLPSDPWVVSSGKPITTVKGHCWYLGGEVQTRKDIDRIIDQNVNHGLEWVKVMATGGFVTQGVDPTVPQFDQEELSYIVQRAHSHGLSVTAHAHSTIGIRDCINAHVDGIEHCSFLSKHGIEVDLTVAQSLADQGIYCGFTIPILEDDDPRLEETSYHKKFSDVQRLIDLGVPIVFSTDAGISANKTFDVLPNNLVYAHQKGINALDLLRGVTSIAAQCCGKGENKGRIKTGYAADYNIAPGNPATNLNVITSFKHMNKAVALS